MFKGVDTETEGVDAIKNLAIFFLKMDNTLASMNKDKEEINKVDTNQEINQKTEEKTPFEQLKWSLLENSKFEVEKLAISKEELITFNELSKSLGITPLMFSLPTEKKI